MRHVFLTAFVIVFLAGAAPLSGSPPARLLGDRNLGIQLRTDDGTLVESQFVVNGSPFPGLRSAAWNARIDGQTFGPTAPEPVLGLRFDADEQTWEGQGDAFTWTLRYVADGSGRITKHLTLTARHELRLEQVSLWHAWEGSPPAVPRTHLQDIAAIYRAADDAAQDPRGLFVSLDFPCSRIESAEGRTRVYYPPWQTLRPGESYEAHSLTIGVITRHGVERYGFDTGEVAAFDTYIQERFTPRFERPLFVSCSIVNRYTQVRGDVIFYTMHDHPTLRDNTDLLERELALMPELGMEYYQVFPGVFDWGPDDPSNREVHRLMNIARAHGVRMGDYSGTNGLFCPHYNEYRNNLHRPEWLTIDAEGKPLGAFCFGCPQMVDHYINGVVPPAKRFGFEMHCLDFLNLQPCHSNDHGHPPGPDSAYHAVKGLLRILAALDGVSPEMMTWSNSGNWAELLPKIAWHNPNLYLTDPFISTPWQGLNMTRLLDDARREQMVSLHYSRFIPYRFLTNCQYFFSQNSVVPDIRHFEYGALSTLAVTPNLCLAEIRPWVDRLPESDRLRVTRFYRQWTNFVREHFELWKQTYHVGDDPGTGSVEIYGHAAGNRGFIFLVNPQYSSRCVEVPLNNRLGFTGRGLCELQELYPTQRLRLTSQGPFAMLGSTLTVKVPAQQVIVLEVRPAPTLLDAPRLFGIPGSIEPAAGGYVIRTSGMQGRKERAAVLLPADASPVTGAQVRVDVPKIPKRLWSPTPLTLSSAAASDWAGSPEMPPALRGPLALLDVTFRRESVPDELREWFVRAGTLEEGLAAGWFKRLEAGESLRFPLFADVSNPAFSPPMTDAKATQLGLGPLANFCGAYIENAFGEQQETWIDLQTGGDAMPAAARPVSLDEPLSARGLPAQATEATPHWWLQTRFGLPFMHTIGAEPAFDEHTILVLPMIRTSQVQQVNAWINGHPLDVRLYRYPRNRTLGCYFADLVGTGAIGGENTLVVQLTY